MKVALVYPPYGPIPNEPSIPVVKKNYGVFQSLSLLYVGGILQAHGHEVLLVDANALGLGIPETIRRLRAFGPGLIGYTLTTHQFFETLVWIKAIRRALEVPVLVGGMHVTLYPKETLSHTAIDYGLIGEVEESLPTFIEAFLGGTPDETVPGLVFRRGDEIVAGPEPPLIRDLDTIPPPARGLVDHSLYHSFLTKHRNFMPIITSRGCPYRCIFCEQGRKPYRSHSVERIIDEMKRSIVDHGAGEFDFFDSLFSVNRKRVLSLCEAIQRHDIVRPWSMRTRVDLVDEEMLRELARAGCTRIYYGIESGSPPILERLNKFVTLEQITKVMHMTDAAGIAPFGFFLIGSPGETRATAEESIRFALSLPLEFIQLNKVTAMPDTLLYKELIERTGRDHWREATLAGVDPGPIPRLDTDMTEEEILSIIKWGYLRFYLRPRHVARALFKMRSVDEVLRSGRAVWDVLWS